MRRAKKSIANRQRINSGLPEKMRRLTERMANCEADLQRIPPQRPRVQIIERGKVVGTSR